MGEIDIEHRVDGAAAASVAENLTSRTPREKFQRHLYHLGITEIIICVLICSISIATLFVTAGSAPDECNHLMPGLWCGVFLFICGICGTQANNNGSVGVYTANMIFSVLAMFMMILLIVLSVLCSLSVQSVVETGVYLQGMHNTIALLGFTSCCICLIHACYCITGLCCSYVGNRVQFRCSVSGRSAAGQYGIIV